VGVIYENKIPGQPFENSDVSENAYKMGFEHRLTKRELEICDLIANGHSSLQISKYLFISEGTVKNYITSIYEKTGVRNRAQLTAKYIAEHERAVTYISDTAESAASTLDSRPAVVLRLIGDRNLPDIIPVTFKGQTYTIGRFDVSIGRKQCDFEFGRATVAVSRRHAAIEESPSGFAVIDLNSRAGTFVNGNRIKPGIQCAIVNGDLVSFGNAGADYIFEC